MKRWDLVPLEEGHVPEGPSSDELTVYEVVSVPSQEGYKHTLDNLAPNPEKIHALIPRPPTLLGHLRRKERAKARIYMFLKEALWARH